MLSELLGASEPLFTISLEQLERGSANPSADVRLTAEIIGKTHMQMKALGLDPRDTTGKELYQALMNLTAKHDTFLANRLGGKDPEDVHEMLPLIKRMAERIDIPKDAWVLKHSVAKKLLKACPPKKVMKQLGYRSIDSMLKREPIDEIYGALRFAESPQWLENFLQKYKKLTPADFETRRIEIIHLDSKKWGATTESFVHKKRHNITHLKELGVILMLPMPMTRMRGITITALPLLLHYINEIRLYSAYFKMQQVNHKFGEILVDTLIADPSHHAVMAGQHIHWRVIQRYFGKLEKESHPEIFEPHVQPEDLHWRKAEEVLYRLEPALHFWHDMDYVGLSMDERPVSFNLMDMAVSYVNQLPYGSHAIYHFRESLWNEIFMRYMGQRALENQVLKQLDNEMIEPETMAFSIRGL
ncbi:MAG: hypothetical protein JWL85_401 [Candidatus Saccharibacteria bacterium]|nr:hypothetical protein [Candidatus Saccharibacteria bacterium]